MLFELSCLVVAAQYAVAAALPATATVAPPSECAKMMDGKLPAFTPSNFKFSGTIRKYYIAAEEVEWDYAPTGWDDWLGVPLKDSPRAKMAGYLHWGTKWLKALYREYTDSTFSSYAPQPSWQGVQGPSIRSEVGDLVEIMFFNKLTKNYATMHSMGLSYTKYNEGASYPNNTRPGENVILPTTEDVSPRDKGVGPRDCVVYKWLIDDSATPPPGEPAQVHSYHSYVTMEQDLDAGLIGPHFVYASGKMNATMSEYREFPLLYMTFAEDLSWLSGENEAKLNKSKPAAGGNDLLDKTMPKGNTSVWSPQNVNLEGSMKFSGAPTFYSLNGFVFGTNPSFETCLNQKAIWYVNAYGPASHAFHMHGNVFTNNGLSQYAVGINDGVGVTLYMNSTNPGKWQLVCHVSDHHSMGMESYYTIFPTENCKLSD